MAPRMGTRGAGGWETSGARRRRWCPRAGGVGVLGGCGGRGAADVGQVENPAGRVARLVRVRFRVRVRVRVKFQVKFRVRVRANPNLSQCLQLAQAEEAAWLGRGPWSHGLG